MRPTSSQTHAAQPADNVVTHAAFTGGYAVPPRNQKWREQVVSKLESLMRLPSGWDGYVAKPISFNCASFSLSLLDSVCAADFPAPSIVPGLDGDLQLEWHTADADIELHIRNPNDVHAWRSVVGNGQEDDLKLTVNFKAVAIWLNELSERAVVANAAAA